MCQDVARSTRAMGKRWAAELELKGLGGEPVDLWRTLASHGVAELPPQRLDEGARTLETTVPLPRGRARTIRIGAGRPGFALVEGDAVGADGRQLAKTARHILRLDADLSPFYEVARSDSELAWAVAGAGRMLRSPTVFEDVVKTICTPITTQLSCRARPPRRCMGQSAAQAPGRCATARLANSWPGQPCTAERLDTDECETV
jgi:hypothetical protein